LVKAGGLPAGHPDAGAWSETEFLDAAFPRMARATSMPWRAVTLGSDPTRGLTPGGV